MKDTPAVIERKFRQMLMKRSGEERLKMGCSMHATAQALAKASVLQQHPCARPAEIKRLLFLHFYGNDFEPEERKRIASALAKRGEGSKPTHGRFERTFERAEAKTSTRVGELPACYGPKRPGRRRK